MKATKFLHKKVLVALSFAFCTTLIVAQSLKINPSSFSMVIAGTTNVHDFESKVTQVSGEIILDGPKQVKSLVINVPVKSIKGKEKLMDTKTYETFKVDKYPNITFRFVELNSIQVSGDKIDVTLTGNLTMAGVTKRIVLKSTGVNSKTGTYRFKGSVPLKMSDFKMSAPTAMMGMMKVGDAVTLKFDATFEGEQLTLN